MKVSRWFVFMLGVFLTSNALALELDKSASSIHFISMKKNTVGEIHKFDKFSFELEDNDQFKLKIELVTVNTGIPVRDQRLRDVLFETVRFPQAIVSGKISKAQYNQLATGQSKTIKLDTHLYLHGIKQALPLVIEVLKQSDQSYRIIGKPFLLNAKLFGLSNGVAKFTNSSLDIYP